MQLLSEKGRLDSFLSGSFSMKIFDQISRLPESQNYIKQTMGRIFETIDLDYIETINLELAAKHCKEYIDESIPFEELIAKAEEEEKNVELSHSPVRNRTLSDQERESEMFTSMDSSNFDESAQITIEIEESNESISSTIHRSYESPRKAVGSRSRPFDLGLPKKVMSNIDDYEKDQFFEQADDRNYSISMMRRESEVPKSQTLKELQKKIELSKFLLKTMLNAVFFTSKYIPTIIRIFLKIVGFRYEKYCVINDKFYKKSKDGQDINDKAKVKSEVHRLLVDIIASKWIVYALFINPDKSGLIVNRPILKLRDTFVKFSKIFVYSLRGQQPVKAEENFMILFGSFMSQHIKNARNFIRSVLNISLKTNYSEIIKYENYSILDTY